MVLVLIVAISLSMDAFSLALAYGTLNIDKTKRLLTSFIVGVYHFIMPLLGLILGKYILGIFEKETNFIAFLILLFLGLEMIVESFKNKEIVYNLSPIEILLFGFAVSIDAFSVGITLPVITSNYFLAALCFSIVSFTFTYFGLKLGNLLNQKFGNVSTILGGGILITIGIIFLFK